MHTSGTTRLTGVVALVAVLACGGCGRSAPAADPPTGLLLVTVDTLRADHLGCYGAPGELTPNVDRLAAEGVRFLHATTPIPVTLPAHASLMTAQPPPVHGVRDNGIFRLGPALPTLAERLRDAGWASAAFVGSVVLDAGYGLDRGFEPYDDTIRVSTESERAALTSYPERPAGAVVDATLAWLRERPPDSRFFAWVHLFDPHFPYDPPEPARALHGATYRGEVAYVDEQIGRLLDGLAAQGRAGDTLVVLTSDHGEGLGEHGEATHGYLLYESTLHVPLILHAPGRLPAGRRVDGTVGLTDVAPTILDLAGLPPLPGVAGTSLAAAAREGEPPSRSVYLETYLPYFEMRWSGSRGLRRDGWKYLFSTGPELYDLAADPDETTNLAGSRPDLARPMDAELRSLSRRFESAAATDAGRPGLSEEDEARLRSLGYLGGGAPVGGDLAARAERRPDTRRRIHLLDTLLEAAPEAIDRRDPAALSRLEGLCREDPDNPRLLTLLGKALIRQGRPADAIAAMRRAAELDPADPQLLVNLGTALLLARRGEEAAVVIDGAIALRSGDPGVRRLYGDLLVERDPPRAEGIFRDLLRGNPQDLRALRGLARALAAQDRWAEALEATEHVLELEPESVDDLVRAGMAAIRLQRVAEAEGPLRRALERSPDEVGALLGLSLVLQERDDRRGAQALLERAAGLAPDDPVVLMALARAAAGAGDLETARRALRHSLEVNPDQPAAREMLRGLER